MTTRNTVRLLASLADTPAPMPSLMLATAEPPRSGEAVVVDPNGLTLAQAIEVGRDCDGARLYRWAITGVGCARIETEARS